MTAPEGVGVADALRDLSRYAGCLPNCASNADPEEYDCNCGYVAAWNAAFSLPGAQSPPLQGVCAEHDVRPVRWVGGTYRCGECGEPATHVVYSGPGSAKATTPPAVESRREWGVVVRYPDGGYWRTAVAEPTRELVEPMVDWQEQAMLAVGIAGTVEIEEREITTRVVSRRVVPRTTEEGEGNAR